MGSGGGGSPVAPLAVSRRTTGSFISWGMEKARVGIQLGVAYGDGRARCSYLDCGAIQETVSGHDVNQAGKYEMHSSRPLSPWISFLPKLVVLQPLCAGSPNDRPSNCCLDLRGQGGQQRFGVRALGTPERDSHQVLLIP